MAQFERKKIKKGRLKKLNLIEEKIFLKNLNFLGYKNIKKQNHNSNKKFLTEAFQRKYRQSLVNGKIDKECLLISKNLIKSQIITVEKKLVNNTNDLPDK